MAPLTGRVHTGVHFNTTHEKLLEEIERAVTVFGHGLELLANDNNILNLNSNLNCNSSENIKWAIGEQFSRYGVPSSPSRCLSHCFYCATC